MPIPESNGLAHSTIMQNTIRLFTQKSNELADIASAIGAKTYMNKIYKSVGGLTPSGIETIAQDMYLNKYKATQAEYIYKNTCSRRYEKPKSSSETIGFLKLTEEEKQKRLEQSRLDRQQIAGTKYDITLEACIFLEQQINGAKQELDKQMQILDGIKNFYQKDEIKRKLQAIDAYFAIRENQLGWLNSLITPSSALLVETLSLSDFKINKNTMETSTKKNIENNQRALKNKDLETTEDEITDSTMGAIAGTLVWFMLPGATEIKNFLKGIIDSAINAISLITTAILPIGIFAAGIINILAKTVATPLSYYLTYIIMELIFQKIPLLVCVTASVIAFITYLVSLIKYFYLSPFVTAYALATKQTNKIIEFLITGISIFLTPVLIVLFIYLSLFVHTLINEVFLFLSIEQFTGIEASEYNFITNFTINAIIALLKIFGYLSASYIMWKLIISGPNYALSLVGIKTETGQMIAQALENKLASRAFVA